MQRIKFRYLPHTADMAFIAYGSNYKELMENAALALLGVMLDIKRMGKDKGSVAGIGIKETSKTIEDLIWFTLQDILAEEDSRSLKAFKFDVEYIKEHGKIFKLAGRLLHKNTNKDYYKLDVKAVTPHDMRVIKRNGIYSVTVVIDV